MTDDKEQHAKDAEKLAELTDPEADTTAADTPEPEEGPGDEAGGDLEGGR